MAGATYDLDAQTREQIDELVAEQRLLLDRARGLVGVTPLWLGPHDDDILFEHVAV